jgi:hypothetical protein
MEPSTEKVRGKTFGREGGFRLGTGDEGRVERPVAAGKRARYLDVSDPRGGVTVAMRNFWQLAPRAIALSAARMRLLVHADRPSHEAAAGDPRPEYDLDFGQRSLHDILYYFHRGDASQARSAEVAEAFEYPLMARAPTAWYSDSGVWYFEVGRKPEESADVDDTHWVPESAGVARFGENSSYNSGGHHDSLSSGWLDFIRSGSLAALEKNLAYASWSISRNPGWAYQDNELRFGRGQERYTAVDRALADWNVLTAFGPKDFYLWLSERTKQVDTRKGKVTKPVGGWSYFNGYKILPDMEHYALFRLFEYYNLTGDARALDAIRGFVNWDLNFQHVHLFQGNMRPLEVTNLFEEDPSALWRGHYARIYTWMLYTNLVGFQTTGNAVYDEFARWQIRRLLGVLIQRHGQLTSIKYRFQTMDRDALQALLDRGEVPTSKVQTWMEAQGVLALHEAYRTYDDERILDGLWGQADYFAHHVLFFPRLGMINNWTAMPTDYLGSTDASINPLRHDRLFQALPYLYHYTGWPDVKERFRSIVASREGQWSQPGFLQVLDWEAQNQAKSSPQPPEAIMDLRVDRVDRQGIALSWTSPRDDGPAGRASRYFVKYSDKPIVEFAPTDNSARLPEFERVIREVENHHLARSKRNQRVVHVKPSDFVAENQTVPLASPNWDKVNAFWMAEHVDGEPVPSSAGTRERFTITKLLPHDWFGAPEQPDVSSLKPGTYYVAICSWDADRNLSRLSNVVTFSMRPLAH